MKIKQKKGSLLRQVIILFVICVILSGLLTSFFLYFWSGENVDSQIEQFAFRTADEVESSIKEYPAYRWLIDYWYDHSDTMDIEYDVDFSSGTRTEAKCEELLSHQPSLKIKYADEEELNALPEEDQKLYAEIIYSWLTTRINQIKRNNWIDFLFVVITDDTFETQFFLLSAADEGAARGTEYLEIYPLGHTVTVSESQKEAMQSTFEHDSDLADAGDYMDYYAFFEKVDGENVIIGLTYNLSNIKSNVITLTAKTAALSILFQVMLSVSCLAMIILVVLIPLKKVQKGIRTYTETKDSETVIRDLGQIRQQNEIGQLSDDVIELTKEIDDHVKRIEGITAERERIVTELEMARGIQASMLPHVFPPFPDRTEFDIFASMEPAKAVGGDFYNYFLVDDDHLGLIIADVSGKGIPAALFMMVSCIILKNTAMLGHSAADIMTKTNSAICSNNSSQMFITAWVGILEISTGILRASNAGHEYPIIKKPDGQFEVLKDEHGLVIGVMDGMKYNEYEVRLEPGSKLFLYTDGIPEATDANMQMFGMERFLKALNKDPDAGPEQLVENVRTDVSEFVKDAEQFDDMTMLCLEYT